MKKVEEKVERRWEVIEGEKEEGGRESKRELSRRGEEGYYCVKSIICLHGMHFVHVLLVLNNESTSPCVQRERQKDREKLRKKKESDLPGAVMQMNKYTNN